MVKLSTLQHRDRQVTPSTEPHMAKRMREVSIKQKSPLASDRAKPRMVEKSCCLRDGFLA